MVERDGRMPEKLMLPEIEPVESKFSDGTIENGIRTTMGKESNLTIVDSFENYFEIRNNIFAIQAKGSRTISEFIEGSLELRYVQDDGSETQISVARDGNVVFVSDSGQLSSPEKSSSPKKSPRKKS
jgi:hypothetical protein